MEKRYDYITPIDYEQADLNGISAQLLEQRVRTNLWDIDRAINTPKKNRKCHDQLWSKWSRVAIENGVNRVTFTNRVCNLKWDEKEAATTVKRFRRGKFTDQEMKIMETNNLTTNSVNMRITKLGWTREKALNTPKLKEKDRLERVAAGTKKYHKERGVNNGFNKKNRAMGN